MHVTTNVYRFEFTSSDDVFKISALALAAAAVV